MHAVLFLFIYILINGTVSQYSTSVPSVLRSFASSYSERCRNDQNELIVTFKCTKTIQFGERKLHIPLLRLPGSPLCPSLHITV